MASHPLQQYLYPLLLPLGKVYSAAMARRRKAYEAGRKERFAPVVPCISIGNIGWGGSGKTPLADWMLQWAKQQRLRAVVLTRGYKAQPPHVPYVVTPQSLPSEAGDEPCMLARLHPEASIVVDPVRKRSGAMAQRDLKPDVFILDDGFQHLAVTRDADFVLLKPADLLQEWGRVIPSGSWREGPDALSRADAFFIKCSSGQFSELLPVIKRRLGCYDVPVFSFRLVPQMLLHTSTGETALSPKVTPYVLFSGVGEPEQVEETATEFFGHEPLRHMVFSDHHAYSADDLEHLASALREEAQRSGRDAILLCTPKDAVKLPLNHGLPIWTFALGLEFGPACFTQNTFSRWWDELWQQMSESKSFQARQDD